MEKEKKYSGFEVSLAKGSKRKQVLSNKLEIRVSGERSDAALKLTLRQARALKKFLNENV